MDLLSSTLCKEEDELRQNVEQWNQASTRLEMLMSELVCTLYLCVVAIKCDCKLGIFHQMKFANLYCLPYFQSSTSQKAVVEPMKK